MNEAHIVKISETMVVIKMSARQAGILKVVTGQSLAKGDVSLYGVYSSLCNLNGEIPAFRLDGRFSIDLGQLEELSW